MKRIIITIGYQKFLLPESVSTDAIINQIAGAKEISHNYDTSDYIVKESIKLEFKIIDENEITKPIIEVPTLDIEPSSLDDRADESVNDDLPF